MKTVTVRVPATTANLGPGFDCLGLALDLWNEAVFTLEGDGCTVVASGEGSSILPHDETNLVARTALNLFADRGCRPEPGLLIRCRNNIPLSSGLGSSAAAMVAGVYGANALLGNPFSQPDLLNMLIGLEGHGDNVCAAVLGGLVLCGGDPGHAVYRRVWDGNIGGSELQAAVVLPEYNLSTHEARALLPAKVPMRDAVANLQNTALIVNALQTGDLALLGEVMADRLHQPYRLPRFPGSSEAMAAAKSAGAAAAALSGAGPSVIAFGLEDMKPVAIAMQAVFDKHGVSSRAFLLPVSCSGVQVTVIED